MMTTTDNTLAIMAKSDLCGEATAEEIEFLGADENVEEWQRWLTDYALDAQNLLRQRRIQFEGKRNRYRALDSAERRERKMVEGWEDYKAEYFAWVSEVEDMRVEALKRAGHVKRLVKDLRQRRHIARQGQPQAGQNKDLDRLRGALEKQREERNKYRGILMDVQKQLLEVPEFFSEVGEGVRGRTLAKVEDALHPKHQEGKGQTC